MKEWEARANKLRTGTLTKAVTPLNSFMLFPTSLIGHGFKYPEGRLQIYIRKVDNAIKYLMVQDEIQLLKVFLT